VPAQSSFCDIWIWRLVDELLGHRVVEELLADYGGRLLNEFTVVVWAGSVEFTSGLFVFILSYLDLRASRRTSRTSRRWSTAGWLWRTARERVEWPMSGLSSSLRDYSWVEVELNASQDAELVREWVEMTFLCVTLNRQHSHQFYFNVLPLRLIRQANIFIVPVSEEFQL